MKNRVLPLLILAVAALLAVGLLSACGGRDAPETAEPNVEAAPAPAETDRDAAKETQSEIYSYFDAYRQFQDVQNRETHAGYLGFIDGETAKMKEKAEALYNEIIKLLQEDHYAVVRTIQPYRTYDEYCEDFVRPVEKYFTERLAAAELASEAYHGVGAILCYPANSASDVCALGTYAYYRNLYNELCELKKMVAR